MNLNLIIFWTSLISIFAVGGAYYARRFNKADGIIGLYVALVIFANIVAIKSVTYHIGSIVVNASAAVLIFSVTFLLTDIVNEKFGREETQRMILIALFCQIGISLFSVLVVKALPSPFFENQKSIELLLGSVPRIVFASLVAFYVSENVDAYLFQGFKKLTHGKHLWMRNVFSSLPAMFLDSLIFIALAFYGTLPLLPLIFGQTLMKWMVGIIDIPFMYLARKIMG